MRQMLFTAAFSTINAFFTAGKRIGAQTCHATRRHPENNHLHIYSLLVKRLAIVHVLSYVLSTNRDSGRCKIFYDVIPSSTLRRSTARRRSVRTLEELAADETRRSIPRNIGTFVRPTHERCSRL